MAKAPKNMTVEELDAELARLEADNQKDMATKDALREKMRDRAATMDELAAARVAKVAVATMSDAERAALAQEVAGAGGIAKSSKVGTPGGN